jgi:hypothetical protein
MGHEKNVEKKGRKKKNGKSHRFSSFIFHALFLMCLFLASYRSAAQTVPVVQQVQNRTVAVMPFIGDDPEKNNRVRDRVFQEVENHPNYTPISISSETQPETLRLRPDEPPDLMYLGDMPFVLTGEYYLDIDAQEHFQLWLWNSQDGSLVYTDELVAENIEEAESYLPALVSWVFSRIPRTPEMRVAVDLQGAVDLKGAMEDVIARSSRSTDDPSPSGQASFPRLYLGMGMGGSFSTFYIRMTGTYAPSMSQGFGLIAGLSLGFRPWRFFIVQIDPLFSVDVFRVFTIRLENNQNVHTSSQQITTPMLFPLLIRVPIMEDKFNISFAAGVYFTIPIGRLSDEWGAYSIRQDLPLGFIGGMDLGYTIDPGELFFSLRYARDLGMTIVSSGLQYVQSRVTLSIGYRFGFFRKQPPESGTITLTGSGTLSGTGTGAGVLTGTGAAATGTAGTAEAPPIQEQSVEEVWEEFEPGETGLATVGDEPEAE